MQVRTNSDSPGARAPEVGIQHGLREREVDISKENIAGEPTLAVVEAILVQSPNPVASDFYKPRTCAGGRPLTSKEMELRRRVDGSSQLLGPSRRASLPPEDPPSRTRVAQRRVFRSPLDLRERWYWVGLAVVTAASIVTRFYSISEPRHVA